MNKYLIYFTCFFAYCFSPLAALPLSIAHSVDVVQGEWYESVVDLQTCGPHPLLLQRTYPYRGIQQIPEGWNFSLPNVGAITDSGNPSEPISGLKCSYDKSKRLVAATQFDPAHSSPLHHFDFAYSMQKGYQTCTVTANSGDSVTYDWLPPPLPENEGGPVLRAVHYPDGSSIHYEYQLQQGARQHLLTKRIDPLGNCLEFQRYQMGQNCIADLSITISNPTDWRLGRILAIQEHAAETNEKRLVATFAYRDGETEVHDASGHPQLYHYDPLGRITAIEAFLEDRSHPTRIERFFWDEKSVGQMIGKALCDSSGQAISSHTYAYDKEGNVIQEAIWGNLTGNSHANFSLNAKGLPTSSLVESHTIDYVYTKSKPFLLLEKRDSAGTVVKYCYDPKSHFQTAQLFYVGDELVMRKFTLYDSHGFITQQILDDGKHIDASQFQEATERQIIDYQIHYSGSAKGMPYRIERSAVDPKSGQRFLLQSIDLTYTPLGKLESKTSYSPSGKLLEQEQFTYDLRGRQTGKESYAPEKGLCKEENQYDAAGHLLELSIKSTNNSKRVSYTYNASGACISEKCNEDGLETVRDFTYDSVGNRIAEQFLQFEENRYTFDSLGRCQSKITADASSQFSYSEDNLPISIRDSDGNEIHIRYNIRRQPIEIQYPDGTKELYRYNLDGSLVEITQRNGWKIVYTRDFLGRELSTTSYAPDGILVQKTAQRYTPFRLVFSKDANDVETSYQYDAAGRETLRQTASPLETLYVTSQYNSDGELCEQKEWIENDRESLITTQITPIETGHRIDSYDFSGKLIRQQAMQKSSQEAAPIQKNIVFDCSGEPAIEHSQIASSGLVTLTTVNRLGKVTAIKEFASNGRLLTHREWRYNSKGERLAEIRHCIREDGSHSGKTGQTLWKYDTFGQIASLITISEEGSVRETNYAYNEKSQLIRVTRPNGVSIYSIYDSWGRLARLYSSDHTIDYSYTYDVNNRITAIEDSLSETTLNRTYDSLGHLINECFPDQSKIGYGYDARGRRTTIDLPDGSAILYQYDALALTAVVRKDARGEELYRQSYTYALSGELESLTLPFELGELSWQKKGNQSTLQTAYWGQSTFKTEDGYPYALESKDSAGLQELLFKHDEKGRLTHQEGQQPIHYSYNSFGDLMSDEMASSYNEWGELIAYGDQQLSYDANGNLIARRQGEQTQYFHYDALNRLMIAELENQHRIRYQYDPFDRRLARFEERYNHTTQTWQTVKSEFYLYDGNNEIAVQDSKGVIGQVRVLGSGLGADIGAAVAFEFGGNLYVPIHDFRGSVSCLIDAHQQKVVECYRYSPFGKTEIYDGQGSPLEQSAVNNPWRFSSKRFDSETGWYFFGKRYLDPSYGRWTTQDPLAILDGESPYSYVNNSPLYNLDLYGLFSLSGAWKGFKKGFWSFWNWKEQTIHSLQKNYSLEHELEPYIHSALEEGLGYLFLSLCGYYNQPMETGVYGNGAHRDKVRITFLNGMGNIRFDLGNTLKLIYTTHGNNPIHYIFFPTRGWGRDLLRCFAIKFGFTHPTAYALAETWKRLIEEMGGVDSGGIIIHYAHSIGGSNTLAAAEMLSPEERKMLRIVTIGTATIIPDLGFNSIVNYVSVRDSISIFGGPLGHLQAWLKGSIEVTFVGSFYGFPFFDHAIHFSTYAQVLETLALQFLEEFESIFN